MRLDCLILQGVETSNYGVIHWNCWYLEGLEYRSSTKTKNPIVSYVTTSVLLLGPQVQVTSQPLTQISCVWITENGVSRSI